MKNLFCKLIGIMGIFTVCMPCSFSQTVAEKGNGHVITSERPVFAFEKIKSTGSVEVRFHASAPCRATVTVDSNLDKYIEVSVEDGMLNIMNKNYGDSGNAFTKCTIDVYCPALTYVMIMGSGSFEVVDKVTSSTFEANIMGSGSINGKIECNEFTATIYGSGSITATGTSKEATVSISGSGRFNGINFNAKNAAVSVGGSGQASISVADHLKATLFGEGSGGQITYRGNPKVEPNVSGNGRIVKM